MYFSADILNTYYALYVEALGVSFSQLFGGFLYDNVSHRMPFHAQILFIVPSFLLTLFFIKEPEKKVE